ncbi:MAG: DUF4105 domain-containing protein [Candidatus Moranbacteria bacterium]|nr:DUF4105 domain-containing protein [Candidatus Moranbacteria bacterium]
MMEAHNVTPMRLREASPTMIIISLLAILSAAAVLRITFTAPSNNRNWKPEFTVLPEIERNGDLVTISNVRDWRYDPDGPISTERIRRTVDLNDIRRVWFVTEPFEKWDAVAHTFLIFDFGNTEPLVFSVEARGEVGEEFDAIAGAFRHYELAYLLGTERDLLVRRAVFLKNRLYMYPIATEDGFPKHLLSDLLDTTEDIAKHPRFYNTLLHNCTSALAKSANRTTPGSVPWDISYILPGYAPSFLHKLGYIPEETDTAQAMERHRIDDFVKKLAPRDDFSEALRNLAAARRDS